MPLDSSEHRAASPDAYSSTTSAAGCNMPERHGKQPLCGRVKRVLLPWRRPVARAVPTVFQERGTVHEEPNHGSMGTPRRVFQERPNGIMGTALNSRLALNRRVAKDPSTAELFILFSKEINTPAALPSFEELIGKKGKGRSPRTKHVVHPKSSVACVASHTRPQIDVDYRGA